MILKNAFLWVSFVQMGSCGFLGLNTKKNEKKTLLSSLTRSSPEKNKLYG